MHIIGIDLGGTRIKGVLIDEKGQIMQQSYSMTGDGDDDIVWKTAIRNTVHELKNKNPEPVSLVGISAPGLPNEENTAIHFMPGRLQGLERFVWKDYLGLNTFLLNDAVAALNAESKIGIAKNKKHIAMLTLGTGVGGALILNGQPFQGDFCRAGHLGHMVVDYQATPDVTGMPGSLEMCIGNCSLEERTNGRYHMSHDLIEDYKKGDAYATEVWLTSVKKLAIGIASIINIVSPEIIVLGGGITEANEALFAPLEEYMAEYEWRPGGHTVPIVKAVLGDLAGAVGAALFAHSKSMVRI